MIKAPWTKDQVEALNAFQTCGRFHPFTCPNDHGSADRTLIANEGGWYCQHCDYTQDWAHEFMAASGEHMLVTDDDIVRFLGGRRENSAE